MQHTIKAVVRPGDRSAYAAECVEVPVVTQGATLDELIRNLRGAVELALDGEDPASFGLSARPTVVATMEPQPEYA